MNDLSLNDVDDEAIESTSLDKVRAENFAHGLPVLYKLNESDDHYIQEYPDGRKEKLTSDELKALNDES